MQEFGWDSAGLWAVPEMVGEISKGEEMKNNLIGQRKASVLRYKEKRQNRLFSKKIRYQVRKLNAEKRPRLKVNLSFHSLLFEINVVLNSFNLRKFIHFGILCLISHLIYVRDKFVKSKIFLIVGIVLKMVKYTWELLGYYHHLY